MSKPFDPCLAEHGEPGICARGTAGCKIAHAPQAMGYGLGDYAELRSGGPRMYVAGARRAGSRTDGIEYLCTWTDADGRAWHDWFAGAQLQPCAPVGVLLHAACGREVSIAQLRQDVALYVWCEHCADLVEAGDLAEARRPTVPVNMGGVRLEVSRERVRLFFGDPDGAKTKDGGDGT